METNYNEVHVKHTDINDLQEINPEYVYLTIPTEYVCIYHKLLVYMADFGKTLIDDCNAVCKGNSKNIITCWNLFQSAVACHTLGDTKVANFFINYIKEQLELVYKGSGLTPHNSTVPLAISDDGKLKAIVSCDNVSKFYVDAKTGQLYQEYLDNKNNGKVYTIEENNLKFQKE